MKVILGIMGFAGGFVGGWMAATSLAPGHDVIALVSALLGGVIGGVLCVWLYFLGIFLLGASAGVVVAGAVFAGMGHEAQPIFLLVSAVAFGLLALVLQKFMIIVSFRLQWIISHHGGTFTLGVFRARHCATLVSWSAKGLGRGHGLRGAGFLVGLRSCWCEVSI